MILAVIIVVVGSLALGAIPLLLEHRRDGARSTLAAAQRELSTVYETGVSVVGDASVVVASGVLVTTVLGAVIRMMSLVLNLLPKFW